MGYLMFLDDNDSKWGINWGGREEDGEGGREDEREEEDGLKEVVRREGRRMVIERGWRGRMGGRMGRSEGEGVREKVLFLFVWVKRNI